MSENQVKQIEGVMNEGGSKLSDIVESQLHAISAGLPPPTAPHLLNSRMPSFPSIKRWRVLESHEAACHGNGKSL
ncbi:MAG: hypothetical protein V8T46_11505 [Sutterella seckii]